MTSRFEVRNSDCLDAMRTMPANSVEAIITDPPYEIGFAVWDKSGIAFSVELWKEALRVLKPGGHLIAFSASRTYHRLACAVEDAGFDMREQGIWLHANGVPKSMNLGLAIDRSPGNLEQVYKVTNFVRDCRIAAGKTNADIDQEFGTNGMAGHWTTIASQAAVPTWAQWLRLKSLLKMPDTLDSLVQELNGNKGQSERAKKGTPLSENAEPWADWETGLKPAHEPFVIARKPFSGTIAQNIQAVGLGAFNVGATRIQGEDQTRWPANVQHDGSEVVINVIGMQRAKYFFCAKASNAERDAGLEFHETKAVISMGSRVVERKNIHPTVKPVALMEHLCKLVTPQNGVILDIFTGSGSTGIAAVRCGFRFIGIEKNPEYVAIARSRIAAA